MPGTRNPNATLCHSEHSEESREERKEILRFALNDKLIVNCYAWLSERKFRKWRKSTLYAP